MTRLTSTQLRTLLLVPLSDGKIWRIDDLRQWVETKLNLSDEDRMPYPKRPNEQKWYAAIDNALSPSRETSLTSIGEVNQVEVGLYQITGRGREKYLLVIEPLRRHGLKA